MNKIRKEFQQKFSEAFGKLNAKQKVAVETIEGPIVTIAGPGTGKTQLLAIRIGNILNKTDVYPHNILCLTYTDAGAVEMRNRILQFIGPDAYHVNIFTFHGFCNQVIMENTSSFGEFRDPQLVSELENIEILQTLIDNFGNDHPLKRFKKDVYYEARRLKELFELMKKEGWNAAHIHQSFEAYKTLISNPLEVHPSVLCGRKFYDEIEGREINKGEISPKKLRDALNKYTSILAAADEFENYQKEMKRRERFDYQDMILWVIEKFKQDDALLGKYQERFQYILVDEYQDTNGAQNELLFLLADYWENPNLFIVGDDDQSIFRFQGANMNSLVEFWEKYDVKEVVLTENYRSTQKILDASKRVIENNNERLVNTYAHLTKDLQAVNLDIKDLDLKPELSLYQNFTQEEVGIIDRIKNLHNQGVAYKDMALIYIKHNLASHYIEYFTKNNIPINIKKKINVLKEKEVEKIITILQYIYEEYQLMNSAEDKLFDLLHFTAFDISAKDIGLISIYCGTRQVKRGIEVDKKPEEFEQEDAFIYPKWRQVISDEGTLKTIGISDVAKVLSVSKLLEGWIHDYANMTIQTLVEKILTEGNVLTAILKSSEKAWYLQLINTFFDFIKEEAAKNQNFSVAILVDMISKMEENNIEIPINKIISDNNGINMLSAHGSKGLEFDYVFILRANDSFWEKKASNNQNKYSYPPTLIEDSREVEIEDVRRLFYVAMTRARKQLYISYVLENDAGKPLMPSMFLVEIFDDLSENICEKIDDDSVIDYKLCLMQYHTPEAELIDHLAIERSLENFRMSTTSLNKYLQCPLTFYFEKILRVPMARNATMGYGNAIHYALEMLFRDFENSSPRSLASVSKLKEFFIKGMERYKSHFTKSERERYTYLGMEILEEYYQHYSEEWLKIPKFELEYNISLAEYEGVPISGKLDRINVYSDHISVVDYKTGRYNAEKLRKPDPEKGKEGGDYWRQVIFYSLLIDSDRRNNWIMKEGEMQFVEKDKSDGKYKNSKYYITSEEKFFVGKLVVDTYEAIKNHKFSPGCGEEDCHWCNFVHKNKPLNLVADEEPEMD